MFKRTGRNVAFVAGFGSLVAVIGVGGFSWERLALQYYGWRILNEPQYFLQTLEELQESLARQAMLRLIPTKPGEEMLLRVTLEQADDLEGHLANAMASGH